MAAKKKANAAKKPVRKATKKAAPKKAAKGAKKTKSKVLEMIISKSRTKNAVQNCNVSSDFYAALDGYVRGAIKEAEQRATANGRKTLRPQDL
ncbi:MAG: hypothetical protein ISR76_02705 [Planctomycetes bacterium]|nr:hypothetical protein [Planctomycetota bacterium]MBL7007880.1 hypothetical protein [Planctomycetota bacterium]